MDPITGHYTLTGASDWPMLSIIGGTAMFVFQAVLIALVAVIYRSLPKHSNLQQLREEMSAGVKELSRDFTKEIRFMTDSFAAMLEKHLNKEEAARKEVDTSLLASCFQHRHDCQKRNTDLFNSLFDRMERRAANLETRDKP